MEQSLVTTSEKVYFENASAINREELQKNEAIMAAQKQPEPAEESQNEFMEVGKWRKSKESAQEGEMKQVGHQVQQMITQTKWTKQNKAQEAETTPQSTVKAHKKSPTKLQPKE